VKFPNTCLINILPIKLGPVALETLRLLITFPTSTGEKDIVSREDSVSNVTGCFYSNIVQVTLLDIIITKKKRDSISFFILSDFIYNCMTTIFSKLYYNQTSCQQVIGNNHFLP
jgi:hypothetical protein